MTSNILGMAREAIKVIVNNHEPSFEIQTLLYNNPELNNIGSSFVTITIDNELRGCIGTIESNEPLYQNIINNAQSAAINDSRFNPLTSEELEKIKIEISILGLKKEITYSSLDDLKNNITENEDGLIIEYKDKSAVYLPSVWKEIKSKDDFLSNLIIKAEIKEDINILFNGDDKPIVKKYKVTSFKEIKIREAKNKGIFYPNNKYDLLNLIKTFKYDYNNTMGLTSRIGIAPHAGYEYSGELIFKLLKVFDKNPTKRIVVIGPSHNKDFSGISASFCDEYETPLGNLKIDLEYLSELNKIFHFSSFKDIHSKEHSTEVQMPLIKYFFDETPIIELVYGNVSEDLLEEVMAEILKDPENYILVSSDLSHFHNLEEANKLDDNCIKGITTGNFEKCEACGLIGIKAITNLALNNGLKPLLLDYKTSFNKTNDSDSVVGYMSALFYTNKFDFII